MVDEYSYKELVIYPSLTIKTNRIRCDTCGGIVRSKKGRRKVYCKCRGVYIRTDSDFDSYLIRGYARGNSYLELTEFGKNRSIRIPIPEDIAYSLDDVYWLAGEVERYLTDRGGEYDITYSEKPDSVTVMKDGRVVISIHPIADEIVQCKCSRRVFDKFKRCSAQFEYSQREEICLFNIFENELQTLLDLLCLINL